MSIFTDHKVHFAHFTDDNKDTIRLELVEPTLNSKTGDDDVQLIEYYLEAKEGNAEFEELLKIVDIDALHENTVNYIRQERDRFEQTVMEIGIRENLIHNTDPITSNIYETITELLFSPFDEEKQKEQLFMMKLKIFEVDEIKSSKNRPLKAKLRKAKNFVDVMKYSTMLISPEEDAK